MTEKITIRKLHAGYSLTAYPHRSLVVTAQDLRDIYDYCLLHMAEVEAEAQRYEDKPKGEEQPNV